VLTTKKKKNQKKTKQKKIYGIVQFCWSNPPPKKKIFLLSILALFTVGGWSIILAFCPKLTLTDCRWHETARILGCESTQKHESFESYTYKKWHKKVTHDPRGFMCPSGWGKKTLPGRKLCHKNLKGGFGF
jgi:hypothetical protein